VAASTITECEKAYLNQTGVNRDALYNQTAFSGKFLNDLGEYELCSNNEFSKYMLARYTIISKKKQDIFGDSFNRFVTGFCVPKQCVQEDHDHFLVNDGYFNFSSKLTGVKSDYFDVAKSDDKTTAASVMLVVFVFLIVLGLLGLIVENTSLGQKPNLKSDEEEAIDNFWDKYYGNDGFSADDDEKEKMDSEYQKFTEAENKLIMSKTLWGILLLSFSFKRNAKRLFEFSIIKRKHSKTTMIEGLRVVFLFWVMIGNTFLYSFYSYPANFHKMNEMSQSYFFITLFNNELAFDTLLFLIAFIT
jgi:hypothetical protein